MTSKEQDLVDSSKIYTEKVLLHKYGILLLSLLSKSDYRKRKFNEKNADNHPHRKP